MDIFTSRPRRKAYHLSTLTLVLVGLESGCALEGADTARPAESAQPPAPLALAPSRDGVTLLWAGLHPLSARVTSEGLGPVSETRREADGSITLMHPGGVEERWIVTSAEAEQSWQFPVPPAGDRITVDVDFEGARFEHVGDDGVWLRLPTGETIRYGHATWVDATGRRTTVRSRWNGTRVALEVPAEVVATTVWPAVLDPLVSRVFAVDSAIVSYPRARMERPAAAFNNGVHLATWLAFVPFERGTSTYPAIQFARVSPTGEVLDPYGINAPHRTANRRYPTVAAFGSGFLLAWGEDGAQSFGVRVDVGGRVLDPTPIRLNLGHSPAAACHPDGCVVVTTAGAVRLGADGAVLGPAASAIPSGLESSAIVRTASGYVVAWAARPLGGPSDVFFLRLRRDGTAIDAEPQTATFAASNRQTPRLASDGTSALLVWNATVGSGSRAPGIYGVVIPPTGPAPTSPLVFSTTSPSLPDVAWDGVNYLVTWQTHPFGTVRVTPAGTILDSTPRLVETGSALAAGAPVLSVGTGGPQAFWLWSGDGTPYTTRLGTDGRSVAPPVRLSLAATLQLSPASAWDGSRFVVTWLDTVDPTTTGQQVVRAARITSTGEVLDRPPLVLARAPDLRAPSEIATDGTNYAALTSGANDPSAVSAVRFTAAGPSPGGYTPFGPTSVNAFSGFQWIRGRTNNLLLTRDRRATRMSATGTVLDTFPIALGWPYAHRGAFDGNNYFIVGGGYGARITADGDLIDTTPRRLAPMPLISSPFNTYASTVSFAGGNYLVTWRSGGNVVGIVVRTNAEVADVTPRTFGPANSYWQTADGLNHVLVYRSTTGALTAQRVNAAGVLIDPTPLPLSTGHPLYATEVSLASNTTGQTLVTSTQFDPAINASRVVVQIIDSTSTGIEDAGVDAGPADSGQLDSGPVDSGPVDSGRIDSGLVDVGVDSGPVDSGRADSGPVDSGRIDSGRIDSGPVDSGRIDSGLVDVGVDSGPVDSGSVDSGLVDVGVDSGGVTDSGSEDSGPAMDDASADAGRDAGASPVDVGRDVGGDVFEDAGTVPSVDAATDAGAAVDVPVEGGDTGGGFCSARPWSSGRRTSEGWMLVGVVVVAAARRRKRAQHATGR